MYWFVFSILSIFALATAELSQQYLLNRKNAFSERSSYVITFFLLAMFVFPLIIIFGKTSEIFTVFKSDIFVRIALVGIFSSVAMSFYFKSFKVKNISISTIFVSLSMIVSTILGIIVFGESSSFIKFVGIFLILLGIISLNIKNPILEKNHVYGLSAGLLFGVVFTLDKSILMSVNILVYIFWAFLALSIAGFATNPKEVTRNIKGKKLKNYYPIFISGVGYFLYNFFTFSAYQSGGEVGRVDAINNSQVFLIILFEYFILRHTDGTLRKVISATIAFTGVILLCTQ